MPVYFRFNVHCIQHSSRAATTCGSKQKLQSASIGLKHLRHLLFHCLFRRNVGGAEGLTHGSNPLAQRRESVHMQSAGRYSLEKGGFRSTAALSNIDRSNPRSSCKRVSSFTGLCTGQLSTSLASAFTSFFACDTDGTRHKFERSSPFFMPLR